MKSLKLSDQWIARFTSSFDLILHWLDTVGRSAKLSISVTSSEVEKSHQLCKRQVQVSVPLSVLEEAHHTWTMNLLFSTFQQEEVSYQVCSHAVNHLIIVNPCSTIGGLAPFKGPSHCVIICGEGSSPSYMCVRNAASEHKTWEKRVNLSYIQRKHIIFNR